jgi:hypothetical protein
MLKKRGVEMRMARLENTTEAYIEAWPALRCSK